MRKSSLPGQEYDRMSSMSAIAPGAVRNDLDPNTKITNYLRSKADWDVRNYSHLFLGSRTTFGDPLGTVRILLAAQ